MRHIFTKTLLAIFLLSTYSPNSISAAENSDSIKVELILRKAHELPKDSSKTLYFANQFLGVSYVGGTLEESKQEQLLIDLKRLDCTTFVENIIALVQTERQGDLSFPAFKKMLQKVRYRHGEINGYTSRLHYMTDWIADNQEKGLIKERILKPYSKPQTLYLNFMSTHPESYWQIKNSKENQESIRQQEKKWQGVVVSYVDKEYLKLPSTKLQIKNGDMLALVTTIKGLDVVHVGFAQWIGEKLHLLHASSAHKKVILDPMPLYNYMKTKKSQLGVRVIATE